nr:uncharacterized protein LOC125419651 [Ziziphus jujuba var. spinosa]
MAYTLKAFMEVEGRKSPWDNPSWGLARKSPSVVVRKSPCEEACKTPLEEAFEEAYKAYVEEDCKPYRVESREGYRKEFQSHLDTIASDNKLARKASILVPKELDALVKPLLNTLVYRTRVKAVACVPLIQKKWFQLISSTSNILVPPQFGYVLFRTLIFVIICQTFHGFCNISFFVMAIFLYLIPMVTLLFSLSTVC